ncbi:hypothetical protein ACFYXS_02925 [Streptomyces sp. NPDC002574]|uniref:DUF7620 family protein n=1 Tax=Streptomyces sp. NPDC002574 TaxID=3364652 RepID=UPI0036ACD604
MRLFPRRSHPSPESTAALKDAEQSLLEAQARTFQVEAKLRESHEVAERLRAHNRSNAYSDFIEGIVLGRLTDG